MNAWLAPYRDRLRTMDPRLRMLLLAAGLLFVAVECWMLVLRAPVAEWRALRQQIEQGDATVPVATLRSEVRRVRETLAQAEQRLKTLGWQEPDDEKVMDLIARLDAAARGHGVQLGQVRAAGRRAERDVQVATFDAEAKGAYLAAMQWLQAVEAQAAPLQVGELQIDRIGDGGQVMLKVRLQAFLPLPASVGVSR